MQFNDTSNLTGIIQQLEMNTKLGDGNISGNTVLLKQFTAKVNNWYSKATQVIITADGKWRWDDTNQTNSPTAYTSLVTDQTDYQMMSAAPSSGQDWLEVERVEIKNADGTWVKLKERNLRRVTGSIEQERTESGTPTYYDFDGSSIYLDVKPNYDSSGGLKVWFSRNPLQFAYDDTTKRPGFNTIFQEYLVLGPQYDWEKINVVGNPEQTLRDIKEMEVAMRKFYGTRDQAEPVRIVREAKSFR